VKHPDEPLATGEREHVAVLDGSRDHRNERAPEVVRSAEAHAREERRARARAAPRRAAAVARAREDRLCVVDRGLQRLGQVVVGIAGITVRVPVMRCEIVDRHLGLRRGRERSEREAAMRDDLCTGFAREARCAAEVVRVRVGDDHRVYVARGESGLRETRLEHLPGAGPGQPGSTIAAPRSSGIA
jgi:hypothetical protein